MRHVVRSKSTALALFVIQLIFIVVFASISKYGEIVQPSSPRDSQSGDDNEPIRQYYNNIEISSGVEDRRCWNRIHKRSTLRRLMNLRSGRNQNSLRTPELSTRRSSRKDPTFGMALVYIQGALLCAYTALVVYHPHADASDKHNSVFPAIGGYPPEKNILRQQYAMFQDVHVMVVIGFGFLMVFLRKYGYSSVGFTLLMTAVLIQCAMLFQGLFKINPVDGKVHLSINSMLDADVATAAVLISMGAVLGRTTPLQLIIMGIIEIILYSVNAHLCATQIQSADLGGSMIVHVYGAYFGLAVSRVLGPPTKQRDDESSKYVSDILAMIGTTFLWVFWPSFNGVLATGHSQHRAVLNTYLALAASCVTAMASSALFGGGGSSVSSASGRFKMVHVQNATLAGGVAVGAVADLMLSPAGALGVGGVAGIVSVAGYAYLQPLLLQRIRLHDTCGVHNLHGMPGVASGLVSAIMAATANVDSYKHSLYQIYPARAPPSNSSLLGNILEETSISAGTGRSAGEQAGYQILALLSSLVFGLMGGAVTGVILRDDRILRQVSWKDMFSDSLHWDLPEELTNATAATIEPLVAKNPAKPAGGVDGGSEPTGSQRKPAIDENPSGPATATISQIAAISPAMPGAISNNKNNKV